MPITTGEYLDHLRRESELFEAAIAVTEPLTDVPTCPGWSVSDLLWHLAEVQWFWGTVVRDRIVDDALVDGLQLDRPADPGGLRALFREASETLVGTLAVTPPETPAWTWSSDRTVAFIVRRQAHEALVHRVDAEVAAGARTPVDPRLAADGVDEVLRIMYGRPAADTAAHTGPDPAHTLRVTCSDTGDTWLLALTPAPTAPAPTAPAAGAARAGAARDGAARDGASGVPALAFLDVRSEDDGSEVAAQLTGAAADLDCWLWNRPATGPVTRSGDATVLAALDAVVAAGVQ